jgi:hypothetical protein
MMQTYAEYWLEYKTDLSKLQLLKYYVQKSVCHMSTHTGWDRIKTLPESCE